MDTFDELSHLNFSMAKHLFFFFCFFFFTFHFHYNFSDLFLQKCILVLTPSQFPDDMSLTGLRQYRVTVSAQFGSEAMICKQDYALRTLSLGRWTESQSTFFTELKHIYKLKEGHTFHSINLCQLWYIWYNGLIWEQWLRVLLTMRLRGRKTAASLHTCRRWVWHDRANITWL